MLIKITDNGFSITGHPAYLLGETYDLEEKLAGELIARGLATAVEPAIDKKPIAHKSNKSKSEDTPKS